MAYYRLSQVVKMRREALGLKRNDFDTEGPSFMTVYRMEKGKVRAYEKTFRKLTRVMGEEESTRRGILRTKDVRVLQLTNEITDSFLHKDYERTEILIKDLKERLDYNVKRNQQYFDFITAKLEYKKGNIGNVEFLYIIKEALSYGTTECDKLLERKWPFFEREWSRLSGMVETIRREKDYKYQQILLNQMLEIVSTAYMEQEYKVAYIVYIKYRIGDVLGNLKLHREAIEIDEATISLCEDRKEWHNLAEVYYDIFWNYQEIKKKETLTEQEEMRCKECLIKAYYLNKAMYPKNTLLELKIQKFYPEEL